jgi:hypothetical protein
VVGHHWGPAILTLARIGSPGPMRFPYSHCGWASLRPSDSNFGQNWKPGTREIPLLSLWLGIIEASLRPSDSNFGQNWKPGTSKIPLPSLTDPNGSFRCMNHKPSTHHSAIDKPVELHWHARNLNPGSFDPGRNIQPLNHVSPPSWHLTFKWNAFLLSPLSNCSFFNQVLIFCYSIK